jgi:hypothetical protein
VRREFIQLVSARIGDMQHRNLRTEVARHGLDGPGGSPALRREIYGEQDLLELDHFKSGSNTLEINTPAATTTMHPTTLYQRYEILVKK